MPQLLSVWRQTMSRRGFFACAFVSAAALALPPVILIPHSNAESLKHDDLNIDTSDKLLRQFFCLEYTESGLLIPSRDYPGRELPPGHGFIPNERECCVVFKQRFLRAATIHGIDLDPEAEQGQSLFVFGSQVSNAFTRELFGDPAKEKVNFRVSQKEWQTHLRWNLHTPPGAEQRTRTQRGKVWTFKDHLFATRGSKETFRSKPGEGFLADDYLLITVLPRFGSGTQRIVLVGGLHAPGTAAVKKLLREPPIAELDKALKRSANQPYYQALFYVSVGQDYQAGEGFPTRVEFVDAVPLEVQWSRS